MDKEMGVITYVVDEFESKQRRKLSHKLSKLRPLPRVRPRQLSPDDGRPSKQPQPKRAVPYEQTEEFAMLYHSLLRRLQNEYLSDAELTEEREEGLRLLVRAFIVMLNDNGMSKSQIKVVLKKMEQELLQALDQEVQRLR